MGCTPPPLRHVLVNVSRGGGQVSSSHQGSDPSPLSPTAYSLGRPLRRTLLELVSLGLYGKTVFLSSSALPCTTDLTAMCRAAQQNTLEGAVPWR